MNIILCCRYFTVRKSGSYVYVQKSARYWHLTCCNIQLTLYKALHFSEWLQKIVKMFYVTVIKTSLLLCSMDGMGPNFSFTMHDREWRDPVSELLPNPLLPLHPPVWKEFENIYIGSAPSTVNQNTLAWPHCSDIQVIKEDENAPRTTSLFASIPPTPHSAVPVSSLSLLSLSSLW